MFIIFSGVSGSGKNTVMNELLKKRKNLFILEQSSATTREKRESDAIYNTYKYMTKEEFEKGISDGEFFEFEEVHGCYYGVLNEALNRVIDNPQNDYMRDIDVKGNIKLRNYLKDKCGVLSIFLDAPDDVIYDRLIKRGESEERDFAGTRAHRPHHGEGDAHGGFRQSRAAPRRCHTRGRGICHQRG